MACIREAYTVLVDKISNVIPNAPKEKIEDIVQCLSDVVSASKEDTDKKIGDMVDHELDKRGFATNATKSDLLNVEQRLDGKIELVKKDIVIVRIELNGKIDSIINSMSTMKWMFGIMIAISGVLFTFLARKLNDL